MRSSDSRYATLHSIRSTNIRKFIRFAVVISFSRWRVLNPVRVNHTMHQPDRRTGFLPEPAELRRRVAAWSRCGGRSRRANTTSRTTGPTTCPPILSPRSTNSMSLSDRPALVLRPGEHDPAGRPAWASAMLPKCCQRSESATGIACCSTMFSPIEMRCIGQFEALAATAVDVDSDDDPETIRQQLRAARRVSPRGDEPRPQLTDSSEMPAALLNTAPTLRTAGIGHRLCVPAAEPISVAGVAFCCCLGTSSLRRPRAG